MTTQPRQRYDAQRRNRIKLQPIGIAQANVNQQPVAHTLFLESAFQAKTDTIFVQEP